MRTLAFLLVGGAALALLAQQAGASIAWQSADDPTPPFDPPPDQNESDNAMATVAEQISPDTRLAAFLAVIRRFESNDDYGRLYGAGGRFNNFTRHPRIFIPINLPGYENKKSSAAGAYQINAPTYDEFAPRLGITDFSPASQDAIAVALLKNTGAYDAILAGDITGAFRLASKRWASLPGSTAGQSPKSIDVALNWFDNIING